VLAGVENAHVFGNALSRLVQVRVAGRFLEQRQGTSVQNNNGYTIHKEYQQ
jgi:hypothetical protein